MSEVETVESLPENTDANVAETAEKGGEVSTPQETESSKEESRVQKRINKLTWEKHEAERRAEGLEARLTALETKPVSSDVLGDLKAPNFGDFGTDEEFNDALQSYNVQTFERLQAKSVSESETRQAESDKRVKMSAYQAKVAAYAETHDGFVESLNASNISISEAVETVLVESDKGAELTHWLANNANDAIRINQLSPILAAKELGRIEASLDAVTVKKASDAPPTQTDLSGGDVAPIGLRDDMETSDWIDKRRAELRERGKL